MLLEQDAGTRTGRRRSRRRRNLTVLLVVLAITAGAILGGAILLPRRPSPASHRGVLAKPGEQRTTLVAITLHDDVSQQSDSLTLFGAGPARANPVTLFLPVGTFSQIPGQGFHAIGKAMTLGDPDLQRLTVENLLGITIDRTVAFDDVTLGRVIDELGGIDIDVQEQLLEPAKNRTQQPAFRLGVQHMDGPGAAVYATFRTEGDSELDRFVRLRKVLDAIAGKGDKALTRALKVSLDADDARVMTQTLLALASVAAERRIYEVLPATAVGAGAPDEVYALDAQGTAELVRRSFSGSLAEAGLDVAARPRVEIRNGNGRPAAGVRVASLLIPAGMKVEVTGNAPRFDFESTRIVVYGDDEESLALGRKVRSLLGVGEVEVGTRGQMVVDVTVVVGRDLIKE